ncbi:helix-turn-helix domain-containing protein [Lacticaseibacillus sp. GG6-2]
MVEQVPLMLYQLEPLLNRAIQNQVTRQARFDCVVQSECSPTTLLHAIRERQPRLLIINTHNQGFASIQLIRQVKASYPELLICCYTTVTGSQFWEALFASGCSWGMKLPFSVKKFGQVLDCLAPQAATPVFVQLFEQAVLGQDFLRAYHMIDAIGTAILRDSNGRIPNDQLQRLFDVGCSLCGCVDTQQREELRKALHRHVQVGIRSRFELELYLFYLFDVVYAFRATRQCLPLQQVLAYVEAHLYQELSIVQIAQACNISHNYLGRLFAERVGISMNAYGQLRKIQLAKADFYFNEEKIIDVGFKLAYNEPGYFTKVFKKYEQVTPSQYKKQLQSAKQQTLDVMS